MIRDDPAGAAPLDARSTYRRAGGSRNRIRIADPGNFQGHACQPSNPASAWVIFNDTCIHPSRSGHEQFAAHVDQVFRDSVAPRLTSGGRTISAEYASQSA
jgi:hypothetical protein